MMYCNRPVNEKEVIIKAYEWERQAIIELSGESNPYFQEIRQWADSDEILEALNVAIELLYQ